MSGTTYYEPKTLDTLDEFMGKKGLKKTTYSDIYSQIVNCHFSRTLPYNFMPEIQDSKGGLTRFGHHIYGSQQELLLGALMLDRKDYSSDVEAIVRVIDLHEDDVSRGHSGMIYFNPVPEKDLGKIKIDNPEAKKRFENLINKVSEKHKGRIVIAQYCQEDLFYTGRIISKEDGKLNSSETQEITLSELEELLVA